MTSETACPICHAACDTWRHALLECNMAKCVWSLREDDDDSLLRVYGDETTDPRLWLHGLCNTLSNDRFVAVLTTLWAIWWARRKAIHEQEFRSPLSTHLFIERFLQEIRGPPAKKQNPRTRPPTATPRWIPPTAGEMKMNVDGAVAKSSNTGAVGVVCRSALGEFVGASVMVFHGVTDPAVLEAHAWREAIALAEDMVLTRVRIASDCLRVINDLKSQVHRGEYRMILNDIQERKTSFLSCEFVHEYRASNNEAHNLARMATTLALGCHLCSAVAHAPSPSSRCHPSRSVKGIISPDLSTQDIVADPEDTTVKNLGETMDFDASSDEAYGQTKLDRLIQDEFFDSSDSDEEVDMMVLMSMQEEMDQ
ncbi:hypothetical protein D1007_37785 [Hordeum vulgare]|nr:hypothetical protein D1007_37785 [Hordeum vulgare]